MIAKEISYKSFRNLKDQALKLDGGVNILYGDNAHGKTNALEGIYLFAHGKSFRTQNDRDMIAFGKHTSLLEMKYEDEDREKELSFELYKTKRRACKISKAPAKLYEVMGKFKAVLFCPDHLSIVKDGPAVRRSFLNSAICQLKPVYLKSLQKYNHILEQRNAILKKAQDKPELMSVMVDLYAEQLAVEAAYIYSVRLEYVNKLSEYVNYFFEKMSNGEKITLKYKNSIKDPSICSKEELIKRYYELFTRDKEKERILGTTLHGIHRDDIEIYLFDKEARLYASQGQQRSIALAMKLGEGEISKEQTGKYPVFLFDDVLSELDKNRQKFVLDSLDDRQVVVTACDISGFDSKTISNSNMIKVKNGVLR